MSYGNLAQRSHRTSTSVRNVMEPDDRYFDEDYVQRNQHREFSRCGRKGYREITYSQEWVDNHPEDTFTKCCDDGRFVRLSQLHAAHRTKSAASQKLRSYRFHSVKPGVKRLRQHPRRIAHQPGRYTSIDLGHCMCLNGCLEDCYCVVANRACGVMCHRGVCRNTFRSSFAPRLATWMSTIPGAGKGLFAMEPIRVGQYLGEYTGRVISLDKFQRPTGRVALLDIGQGKL